MNRVFALLAALLLSVAPTAVLAQEAPTCPEYDGFTCDEWVTDAAGVVADDSRLEQMARNIVGTYGHQLAAVFVPTTGDLSPQEYSIELGNVWGVGDPERDDGIVILIALEQRQTWIETGPGLAIPGPDLNTIASAGNTFFAGGDFEGGMFAVLLALDRQLELMEGPGPTTTTEPGPEPTTPTTTVTTPPVVIEDDGGPPGWAIASGLGALGLGVGAAAAVAGNSRRREEERKRREKLVDDALARLDPSGHELPTVEQFAVAVPSVASPVPIAAGRLATAA